MPSSLAPKGCPCQLKRADKNSAIWDKNIELAKKNKIRRPSRPQTYGINSNTRVAFGSGACSAERILEIGRSDGSSTIVATMLISDKAAAAHIGAVTPNWTKTLDKAGPTSQPVPIAPLVVPSACVRADGALCSAA
jgi:hypothetical protein